MNLKKKEDEKTILKIPLGCFGVYSSSYTILCNSSVYLCHWEIIHLEIMETKFTKGEWMAVPFGFPVQNKILTKETHKGIGEAWLNIHSGTTRDDLEEVEANAKLIAAAPDMFKAIESILPYIENFPPFIQEDIEAAIKKATE
jgi:hypothetical protein